MKCFIFKETVRIFWRPFLHCSAPTSPPPKIKCFALYFPREQWIISYVGRYDFQQVLKCLFYSSFFVSWSCSEDSRLWFTNSQVLPVLWEGQTGQGPFGNRVRIEPKILHACKLLSVLGVELGSQVSEYLQQNSLPLLK